MSIFPKWHEAFVLEGCCLMAAAPFSPQLTEGWLARPCLFGHGGGGRFRWAAGGLLASRFCE